MPKKAQIFPEEKAEDKNERTLFAGSSFAISNK
jgi:hypothetical protein